MFLITSVRWKRFAARPLPLDAFNQRRDAGGTGQFCRMAGGEPLVRAAQDAHSGHPRRFDHLTDQSDTEFKNGFRIKLPSMQIPFVTEAKSLLALQV